MSDHTMTLPSPGARILINPFTRTALTMAVGMIAAAAFAQEQPGSGNSTGNDANSTAAPAAQPVSDQGVSGEVLHTLLGLSMREADNGSFPKEVITAYPADASTWKKLENPAPELPTATAFQYYMTEDGRDAPQEDRTADGNFFLARNTFQYRLISGMGSYNGDVPPGTEVEIVLNSAASLGVQVNDEGITLGDTMEIQQETAYSGEKNYILKAEAPKSYGKTETVAFGTFIQQYATTEEGKNDIFSLKLEKGDNPRQAKLCWYNGTGSIIREVCHLWSVPANWHFGEPLQFERVQIDDMRGYLPPTKFNPDALGLYWVTDAQGWPQQQNAAQP